MLERAAERRIGPLAALVAIGMLVLGAGPSVAAPMHRDVLAQATVEPKPLAKNRPRQARPQIRVQPRYPYRHYHSLYPLPYSTDYPGPNAVRQCVDWYATEHRPSGTVIVPRMRCWWAPG
jgi:hypothetical protein